MQSPDNEGRLLWSPEEPSEIGSDGNSKCKVTEETHSTGQISLVKNCENFPEDHPEHLHCDSCGVPRCRDCGDPQTWKFERPTSLGRRRSRPSTRNGRR